MDKPAEGEKTVHEDPSAPEVFDWMRVVYRDDRSVEENISYYENWQSVRGTLLFKI
jgi:hypothetical protein